MTPKDKNQEWERERQNYRILCHGLLAIGFFTISDMISASALTPRMAVVGTAIMAVWTFTWYVLIEKFFRK